MAQKPVSNELEIGLVGYDAMVESLRELLPSYHKYEIEDFVKAMHLMLRQELLLGNKVVFREILTIFPFAPRDRLLRAVNTQEYKVVPLSVKLKMTTSTKFKKELQMLKPKAKKVKDAK